MTVKELIERLQKCDPNSVVGVSADEYGDENGEDYGIPTVYEGSGEVGYIRADRVIVGWTDTYGEDWIVPPRPKVLPI